VGIQVIVRRGGATLAQRLGIDPLWMGDWSSDEYMDYIDPHTPEGLVSLPVAMTRLCAQLGKRVCRLRPMSGWGDRRKTIGVSSWFAVHASASKA
jgi:hypothetical protein